MTKSGDTAKRSIPRSMKAEIPLSTRAPDTEAALLEPVATSLPGYRSVTETRLAKHETWRTNFLKSRGLTYGGNIRAKLPNGLTLGQEALCQNLVAGMPHGAAYREAYKADHLKPVAVYNRLYHVMQTPRVKARLAELWQQREAVATHTPAQLRLFVLERLMLEAQDKTNTGSTRVRAVELVGKLGGVHAFEGEQGKPASEIDKALLIQRLNSLLGEAQDTRATRTIADNC